MVFIHQCDAPETGNKTFPSALVKPRTQVAANVPDLPGKPARAEDRLEPPYPAVTSEFLRSPVIDNGLNSCEKQKGLDCLVEGNNKQKKVVLGRCKD